MGTLFGAHSAFAFDDDYYPIAGEAERWVGLKVSAQSVELAFGANC